MMRPSHRLLGVAGNAVVVGAAGVSAPIAWLLVPAVVAVSARPRIAAIIAASAAALILLSILIPLVPGHRDDVPWLLSSAGSLALLPLMAWARERHRSASFARSSKTR